MAKKSKEVVAKVEGALVARPEPSPELQAAMSEVKENMESVESFTLPRIKLSAGGMEIMEGEPLVSEVLGTLIHTRKVNQYYEKPYDPNNVVPPDCFSLDGVKPVSSVAKPVHKTCAGCPMAEFGSNSRKSGKACRNLKPMYLVLEDGLMPRQITIPPTSLKAANNYLLNLTERGLAYRKVKTRIEAFKENAKDTYCKLKFVMVEKLNEQRVSDIEFLKSNWLPVMDKQLVDRQAELEATEASQSAPRAEAKGEF